jgi:hypothetical protein
VRLFYEWIGRAVVRFVRYRYARQIRAVAAVAVASVLIGGYLAARSQPPEG